jgi:diguanylate cyclase (GGDEF)-like protein/PAS domain S-box-containing protein
MTHLTAPSVDDYNSALPRSLAARMASILFVLSGVITSSSAFFPSSADIHPVWVFFVGVAGLLIGIVSLVLPWQRWPRYAMLLYFVPVAFVLISLHNFFGGADPYRYSIFYMVAFLWIGITQPRGTAFWFIPLFALSYLAPLLVLNGDNSALSSVFYTLPVCLFVSESLGWVAERLRKVQTALFQSEVRFRSLVQHASDMVLITDGAGMIRYVSPSVERILGYETTTLLHTSLFNMVHPDDVGDIETLFNLKLHQPGVGAPFECRVRHHDTTWRYIETISTNLLHEANIRGIVLNSRDVTERKALEAQLTHQAFHDPLTGLVNRAAFSDRVEQALTRVERKDTTLAVLFLDLDNFKTINDRWGHAAGDQVLIAVAERLHACLRASDAAARLGGDEFAILLEDVSDTANVMQVADRLLDALRPPFPLGEQAVHVGVSIGIAWSHTGRSAADLLRHADIAMYSVKHTGKGRYAVFDPLALNKPDDDAALMVSGPIRDHTAGVHV